MLSSLKVHFSNNSADLGNRYDGHSFRFEIMTPRDKHSRTEELLSTV